MREEPAIQAKRSSFVPFPSLLVIDRIMWAAEQAVMIGRVPEIVGNGLVVKWLRNIRTDRAVAAHLRAVIAARVSQQVAS